MVLLCCNQPRVLCHSGAYEGMMGLCSINITGCSCDGLLLNLACCFKPLAIHEKRSEATASCNRKGGCAEHIIAMAASHVTLLTECTIIGSVFLLKER